MHDKALRYSKSRLTTPQNRVGSPTFQIRHAMYKDYVSSLLQEYKRRKALNNLSLRLTVPTPGSLREECVYIFKKRYHRKDEGTLRVFFKLDGDSNTYTKAIEKFELDKFKPLTQYLRGEIKKTRNENIELLAWLLDFTPRPYNADATYPDIQAEEKIESKQSFNDDLNDDTIYNKEEVVYAETEEVPNIVPSGSDNSLKWYKKYFSLILIGLILMAGLTGYKLLKSPGSNKISNESESCMYWNTDRYERISCNSNHEGKNVIPFDSEKFSNLRKIMNPSSINLGSIGKVWYLKKYDKLEFFTDRGLHPVYGVELKPITDYIIKKYILDDTYLISNGTVKVK